MSGHQAWHQLGLALINSDFIPNNYKTRVLHAAR